MQFSPGLDRLINALRCLPGVGAKTAQRMAFHLLQRERAGGSELSDAIADALARIGHCRQCRMFSEDDLCEICRSQRRDASLICVVESPADVMAIEQSTDYRGHYFVLMGRLSPIDGVGPVELGLDVLCQRLESGDARELILATGSTVEGEATARYVAELAEQRGIRVMRIAHGVPMGGDLEYVDASTLTQAFAGRQPL